MAGGWFDAGVTYYPLSGALYYDIDIGLALSASFSISLAGIINGGVGVALDASLSAHRGPGSAGSTLKFGVFIQIWGVVDVLGLISAYVFLGLVATYDNESLSATGTLQVSIKICWCFTLSINQSVTWHVGSGASSRNAARGNGALAKFGPRGPRQPRESLPTRTHFATVAYQQPVSELVYFLIRRRLLRQRLLRHRPGLRRWTPSTA